MKPEIMQRLLLLWRELEQEYESFPLGICRVAADRVVDLELGLTRVDGIFWYNHNTLGYWDHSWNYLADTNEYVDLTACQFPGIHEKILVLEKDSKRSQRLYEPEWLS